MTSAPKTAAKNPTAAKELAPEAFVAAIPSPEPIAVKQIRRYGWLPELPDHRDRPVSLQRLAKRRGVRVKVPAKVDLRDTGLLREIPKDQSYLGSCTWNATAAAVEYEMRREGIGAVEAMSRLFGYYNARVMIGTESWDSGAFIRDCFKGLSKLGVCRERTWPYDIGRFAVQPSANAYEEALSYQALQYAFVETGRRVGQTKVKQVLALQTPIVYGFTVYPSFEDTGPDGVVRLPGPNEPVLGGHAVLKVGYETLSWRVPKGRRVWSIDLNSWDGWGDHGYFYRPLTWDCDLANADDFWCVQDMEG